jgi:hypothetical protein
MKAVNAKGRLITLKLMSRHPEAPLEPPKVSPIPVLLGNELKCFRSFWVMVGARHLTSLHLSAVKVERRQTIMKSSQRSVSSC